MRIEVITVVLFTPADSHACVERSAVDLPSFAEITVITSDHLPAINIAKTSEMKTFCVSLLKIT
jgi:hypothetical protein